jgi:hypothetical protein
VSIHLSRERIIVNYVADRGRQTEVIGCRVVTGICGRVGMTGEACHKLVIKKSN